MIQIDMEMPKDCDECPCLDRPWRSCKAKKGSNPPITNKYLYEVKPNWCPLIEVKE